MRFANGLAGLSLVALAACSNGGADGPSASLAGSTVTIASVQNNAGTGHITVRLSHFKSGSPYYFELEGGRTVLSDFSPASEFSDTEDITVTSRSDLPAGVHSEATKLHVCVDENCKQEVGGSPMALTLEAAVSPNIAVNSDIELTRTGADAAPAQDVPVSIPAAAGPVSLVHVNDAQGVTMTLDGSVLHVVTSDMPSGTYTSTGHLQAANPLYSADFSVNYVVLPPAGGEHGMSISVQNIAFALSQGEVQTRQVVVTPPTWTTAYTPLSLGSDCDSLYSLRDLGNFTYELTANAVGVSVSTQHACTLSASAGSVGVSTSVQATVGLAFAVVNPPVFSIARDTTTASLAQSSAVQMTDGSAVAWTATTTAPWLVLARAAGTTGVDALSARLDTTHLADYLPGATADVVVSVARADVPPQHIAVGLVFQGPYLRHAWPGGIVGSGTNVRIYLDGLFDFDAATNGSIQVTGARLLNAQQVHDSYFAGNVATMQLIVDQYVPGQPVTVQVTSPALTTQATLQAIGNPVYGAGFAALPYGLRKPPSFSPLNGSLYLAGQDTVWRFTANGASWSLASQSDPGVIDVDPRPDEAHVLAVSAHAIAMLDPLTLLPVWSGAPTDDGFGDVYQVVGAGDPDSKSITHTSDGDAWVTWGEPGAQATPFSSGVGLLSLGFVDGVAPAHAGVNETRGLITPRTSSGAAGEPWLVADGAHKSALVASLLGPDPTWLRGDSMDRQALGLSSGFSMAAAPAAIDSEQSQMLRKDGWLFGRCVGIFMPWNLNGAVPAGQTVGAWGLTPDGKYALLYTYTLTGTGDAATASQPTLHVLHIDTTACGGSIPPVEVSTLALSGVPGCGSPRASGETCAHEAHVTVDAQQAVAFVSGPRGVAAVPLPSSMMAIQRTGGGRAKATAAPPAFKGRAAASGRSAGSGF